MNFSFLKGAEWSRRRFLYTLAGTAGFAGLKGSSQVMSAASTYPFEEVPASSSRITWVHTAGKSSEKYLPETTGAGCAFLDYDNDGWMDIYLVNSGKCDFYNSTPPLRNALYRNNRDGTFTDVTGKSRRPSRRLRTRRRRWRLQRRRRSPICM